MLKNLGLIALLVIFGLSLYMMVSEEENYSETIENKNTKIKFLISENKSLEKEIDYLRRKLDIYNEANSFKLRATAYTARVQETNEDPYNTAIMRKPVPGWTVAVSKDLKRWLGKRVYIEGIGVRKVNDLMNSRFTNHIDILKGNVSDARKFGVKHLDVYLIEPYMCEQ